LTPIAKAFLTETAVDSTSYGIQVLGGHGFIKEWGMEQLLRDTKICCIYEGTTGIQALDLIGRKVLGSKGVLLNDFIDEIKGFCKLNENNSVSALAHTLVDYVELWTEVTHDIGVKASANTDELGAASVDYLMLSGYITLGYMWVKMAKTAQDAISKNPDEEDFYLAKVQTAEFYFARVMPKAHGHLACLANGAKTMMSLESEHFSF
jgi:hypothetical protein